MVRQILTIRLNCTEKNEFQYMVTSVVSNCLQRLKKKKRKKKKMKLTKSTLMYSLSYRDLKWLI
jgi:rRNA-processing protein FCF1